ncbi:hypothetical protein H0H81_007309 [Sphagnurus paluster]|uniref:Uncharacterized protein n=1 Tax=Sphagnurus paluster TaxID=117069 RepID=A0A9P7FXK7_9AGAR|nr:hypothetical protein H0H81_007309 [Sphagnurus paluster]
MPTLHLFTGLKKLELVAMHHLPIDINHFAQCRLLKHLVLDGARCLAMPEYDTGQPSVDERPHPNLCALESLSVKCATCALDIVRELDLSSLRTLNVSRPLNIHVLQKLLTAAQALEHLSFTFMESEHSDFAGAYTTLPTLRFITITAFFPSRFLAHLPALLELSSGMLQNISLTLYMQIKFAAAAAHDIWGTLDTAQANNVSLRFLSIEKEHVLQKEDGQVFWSQFPIRKVGGQGKTMGIWWNGVQVT